MSGSRDVVSGVGMSVVSCRGAVSGSGCPSATLDHRQPAGVGVSVVSCRGSRGRGVVSRVEGSGCRGRGSRGRVLRLDLVLVFLKEERVMQQ